MKSLQRLAQRFQRRGHVREPWRFLNKRDVSPGDRAFLLLQGKLGPAIIGYGRVTGRTGRTWRDVEFEALVNPEELVLAHRQELLAIRGSKPWWGVQASGIHLPTQIAEKLESLVVGRKPKAADGVFPLNRYVTNNGIFEAPEGRLLMRSHFARERDRRLVQSKRNEALQKLGKLSCEVCGGDFSALYGTLSGGAIECHHTMPVAALRRGGKTHIDDLALVCANCHRILHKGGHTIRSFRRFVRLKKPR
jgi:HNH endonuclease